MGLLTLASAPKDSQGLRQSSATEWSQDILGCDSRSYASSSEAARGRAWGTEVTGSSRAPQMRLVGMLQRLSLEWQELRRRLWVML